MAMSVRFFLSRDFSASMDPSLDTVFHEFLYVASIIILDQCNIKIFLMVILH